MVMYATLGRAGPHVVLTSVLHLRTVMTFISEATGIVKSEKMSAETRAMERKSIDIRDEMKQRKSNGETKKKETKFIEGVRGGSQGKKATFQKVKSLEKKTKSLERGANLSKIKAATSGQKTGPSDNKAKTPKKEANSSTNGSKFSGKKLGSQQMKKESRNDKAESRECSNLKNRKA